jgi:hypothetical protein
MTVEPEVHDLHILAGRAAGVDRTCGKKIAYLSEPSATEAAAAMNARPTTRKRLEPYPCAFCGNWHIGREMSLDELRQYAQTK